MFDYNNMRGPVIQVDTEEHRELQAVNVKRRERVAHGVPADGFPNAILIPLREKYRQS